MIAKKQVHLHNANHATTDYDPPYQYPSDNHIPTREDILNTALEYVTKDRQATHGKPESSFSQIAQLWTAYTHHLFTPEDVAAMMILLKIARIAQNPGHNDNWVDVAGYAACGGEIAAENSHNNG
jgi:hypothetical protein